jgi:Flp pilus assembly pilin Flp
MRTRGFGREDGQTASEYALMLGGIAAVLIVLVLVAGVDIRDLFTKSGSSLPTVGGTPPVGSSGTFPTSVDQCANLGWQAFNDPPAPFDDEQECVDYVNGP